MQVALSGALLGLIMGLVLVGHMTYAVVYFMPDTIERRFSNADATALSRVVFLGTAAIVPGLGVAGALLALLSTVLEDFAGTGFDPIPSIPYFIFILIFAVSTAPVALGLLRPIRLHVLFEYVLFVGLFGVAIPWLANSVQG